VKQVALHNDKGEKKKKTTTKHADICCICLYFSSQLMQHTQKFLGTAEMPPQALQEYCGNLLSCASAVDSKKIKWSMKWSINMQESRGTGN